MPVRVFVSSAVANETLATPSRARTVWFTSSRVVAVTTHAPNRLGSFFEATTIVLPALASGRPYFSQQAAVSANAGSISMNSYATPRASRAWTTRSSIIHYGPLGPDQRRALEPAHARHQSTSSWDRGRGILPQGRTAMTMEELRDRMKAARVEIAENRLELVRRLLTAALPCPVLPRGHPVDRPE